MGGFKVQNKVCNYVIARLTNSQKVTKIVTPACLCGVRRQVEAGVYNLLKRLDSGSSPE